MNLVAIVGRPNVGKSTLFNRLIGKRNAIVEDTPGVTRDRLYGKSEWNGKRFMLIDTGGFIPGSETKIEKAIREQAMIAVDEAQAIIFVTDGRDGVTPFDEDISLILRNSKKPVFLIVNKCDNAEQLLYGHEFYSLGLGEPYALSAMSGYNSGDFLDELTKVLVDVDEEDDDERLKIAFLGRPNVGKSSLTNSLLGYERSIVTDIPGTTRDAIDSTIEFQGQEIIIIDTAGLRKRSQVKENIEMYSTLRTARAIERCDIGVVLIDSQRGLEDQDKKIINQIEEARKGLIIAVNKWDLVEKEEKTADNWRKDFYEKMTTVSYAPILFISAITKQRIIKVLEKAIEVKEIRQKRISTSKLNEILLPEFQRTTPPAYRGRDLKINYITQVNIEPPVFAFFSNFPEQIPDSYKRFMERKLREHFDFAGTPISFVFRKKNIER